MFKNVGENIKRYRLLNNMSLQDVADYLNLSSTAIQKYEKGEIAFSSDRLIQFAKLFNVGIHDLLKVYQKPKIKFNNFRKRKKLVGKRLELLKEIIEKEIANYIEILDMNNYKSENGFVVRRYACSSLDDAEEIANKFRKNINISNLIPISDLTSVLENIGVFLIYIENTNQQFDDFDGLSEVVGNIPIIVLLDNIKDGARQRFTIAHELGHLLMKIEENIDEESLCHRFASSLLMPKEALINEFGATRSNISFYELESIKQEYKVSYKAIIHRLKELNIINESFARHCYIKLNQLFTKEDPNPIEPERSNRRKNLIYKLETEGIISTNKACEYLNITYDEYKRKNNNC
jgi:Zn-dependent peptidase ImmA (M78 family)/DNA-binding XRE family transcriptional regulator